MSLSRRSLVLPAMVLIPVVSCTQNQTSSPRHISAEPAANDMIVSGEIIVQFHSGTSDSRIGEILAEIPATVKKQLGSPFVFLIQPFGSRTASEGIFRLQQYKEVRYAEPNRVHRMFEPGQHSPQDMRR